MKDKEYTYYINKSYIIYSINKSRSDGLISYTYFSFCDNESHYTKNHAVRAYFNHTIEQYYTKIIIPNISYEAFNYSPQISADLILNQYEKQNEKV